MFYLALGKYNIPTGDTWLGWRLRKMAEDGKLMVQGDPAKALNEFDVKLPGEVPSLEAEPAQSVSE